MMSAASTAAREDPSLLIGICRMPCVPSSVVAAEGTVLGESSAVTRGLNGSVGEILGVEFNEEMAFEEASAKTGTGLTLPYEVDAILAPRPIVDI